MIAVADKSFGETVPPLKAEARDMSFFYGGFQAQKHINMPVYEEKVTTLIGPYGCGKCT